MRIKIDIEVSPEEIRTLIGLPNLGGLQEDMIHYMRDKMSSGMEESKEIAVMLKQFLPESVSTASNLQKIFSRGMERFTSEVSSAVQEFNDGGTSTKETKGKNDKQPSAKTKTAKAKTTKPKTTRSASKKTSSSAASGQKKTKKPPPSDK